MFLLKQKRKMELKFMYLVRLFSIIGCAYQLYKMSKIYFSYKTVTDVTYGNDNLIELPAVTICYNKLGQLKTEFKAKYGIPELSKIQEKQISFNSLFSINKQFEMIENHPMILDNCFFKSGYKLEVNCSVIPEIKRYSSGSHFYFTIFPQLNGEPDERYFIEECHYDQGYLVQLVFNRTFAKIGEAFDLVNLESSDRKQDHYQHHKRGSVNFHLETKDYSFVKFRKVVTKRMFTPSGKPCFMASTRKQCFEECFIRQFKNETKLYPIIVLTSDLGETFRFSN